jgi:hypothetical protein
LHGGTDVGAATGRRHRVTQEQPSLAFSQEGHEETKGTEIHFSVPFSCTMRPWLALHHEGHEHTKTMKCPYCGGRNFNWARCCDHCHRVFAEDLRTAATVSDASPDEAVDIDPPKTPTMPPFNRGVFLAGIGAIYLYFKAIDLLQPSPGVMLALCMSIHIAPALHAIGRRAAAFCQVRQTVHWLRQFDAAQRATMFPGVFWPLAREHQLADHGHPEHVGLVDRFTFSPVDRGELLTLTWTAVAAAAAIVVTMITLDMSAMIRATGAVCVVVLCATAFLCRRNLSGINRVFEVSPFGLSEIHEDGTIRRILWGGGVTLRNHAPRRRIELSLIDRPFRIDIPYSVVGFARLVELIATKGGFVPAEAEGARNLAAPMARAVTRVDLC